MVWRFAFKKKCDKSVKSVKSPLLVCQVAEYEMGPVRVDADLGYFHSHGSEDIFDFFTARLNTCPSSKAFSCGLRGHLSIRVAFL
jgi:hypothetical protein